MKSKTTFLIDKGLRVFFAGILSSLFSLSASAQNMQDTIIAYFNLLKNVPQEKLYLHLDKPYYGAGEKLWFKGYLVNAVSFKGSQLKTFIITDLITRSDSIVERKKIR